MFERFRLRHPVFLPCTLFPYPFLHQLHLAIVLSACLPFGPSRIAICHLLFMNSRPHFASFFGHVARSSSRFVFSPFVLFFCFLFVTVVLFCYCCRSVIGRVVSGV